MDILVKVTIQTVVLRDIFCKVYDDDKFSRELILEFIARTPGVILTSHGELADVIFIATDEIAEAYRVRENSAQIVVISTDKKHVLSIFNKEITDYVYKPDLSYLRFKASIERVQMVLTQGF